jgi:DNA-directed RNA polymerase sigma subunit (sigma70/sigma32)
MAPFDVAFNRLTEEEKRILEMEDSWRRSNRSIADMFHCTEKRIRSIHYKVIKYTRFASKNKVDAHGLVL